MKITCEFLRKIKACEAGITWFRARPELEGEDYKIVCVTLEADGHPGWSGWLLETIARHGDTPPAVLARMADYVDGDVRLAVARNLNTSPAVLVKLTMDMDRYVREAATATIAKRKNN